jgi:hypothetical protein
VPIGLESKRRHKLDEGCPAAAAGARTPVSWQLGLSNKQPGELLGILGQAVQHTLAVQAVGGWSSPWAPLTVAMAARCLGNARGGEVNSLYRCSCLVEGVTVVHGMVTTRRWRGTTANSSAGAARRTYDDVSVGWSTRRVGRVAHGKRTRMAVRQGRLRRMDQRSEVGLGVWAQ